MQEAQKKLEESKRAGATEEQDKAIHELEQAKAALEEILRQLREEQIKRTLEMLEARFRKMLQLQREVLEGTVRLDKIPEGDRTHDQEIEASRLANREAEIGREADKALLLLRADGTSVAFPEAVAQMRQDIQQITERLAEAKVGKVTQSLEEDVIAALQEMLDALKKAQKDQQNKKPRPSKGGGQPPAQPLVETIAELKLIRSMQLWVNTRNKRLAKLIEGEQADKAEVIDMLGRLGEREKRIHETTRDIEVGKNK
jgi:hypothetical protein